MNDKIKIFFKSFLIRLLFIIFSIIWDNYADNYNTNNVIIKYTDIDYYVFTNASYGYYFNNESIYLDEAYKYPPIYAWLLYFNKYTYNIYGKILFSIFDCFIVIILFLQSKNNKNNNYLWWWMYNPIAISICTRGSMDSITNFFKLFMIKNLIQIYDTTTFKNTFNNNNNNNNNTSIVGICLGLLIYLRIYPIIYVPSLLLYYYYNNNKNDSWKKNIMIFITYLIITFTLLFGISYYMNGKEYLENAILFHYKRKHENKHNFSSMFYIKHLNYCNNNDDNCIENIVLLLSKVPQILIITLLPWYILSKNNNQKNKKDDIIIVLFAITALFVAFNRVCTAQYFTWFICIMPFLNIKLTSNLIIGVILWLVVVLSWLYTAYQYEFQGEADTILFYVWIASILFQITTCANVMNILYTYYYNDENNNNNNIDNDNNNNNNNNTNVDDDIHKKMKIR